MSHLEHVDLDVLRRYGEPGPRYTSYPTAPMFSTDFTAASTLSEVDATNETPGARPLSLYVHLPFCDELCYFCACTMIVTRDVARKARYLAALRSEMDLVAARVHAQRPVVQLHWGGGTPTDHTPEEIRGLAAHLRSRFTFAEDAEVSCEIDPRGMTPGHVSALVDGGFNRVSMGVQDFDEKVQRAVNRLQPEQMTRDVIGWCRDAGFRSVNLDFIYGLPHQTVAGFSRTLDTLVDIAPDRVAVFNFAYVPWLKKHHKKLVDPEALPSPETRLQMLKMAIERLCAAGYVYIGMDHFARPDDELARAQRDGTLYRNFQGYSTHAGCDLYGFGMSAISQLEHIYAQNHRTLKEYYAAIDEGALATRAGYRLTRDDQIRRDVIMRLMCHFNVDTAAFSRQWQIDFSTYFAASLERLGGFMDDNLVSFDEVGLRVSPMGQLVIRNVAMCFDRYLDDLRGEKPVFSRTV